MLSGLQKFITPFGRFFCKQLPFGIRPAPEIFQREMQKSFLGIDGVVCQMHDILVYGSTESEHNSHLSETLARLESAGITLIWEKGEFSKRRIKFLGHMISGNGM